MSVNSKMTAIADAIRSKTKKTGTLTLDQMATDIASIDTSKPEQTKIATPSLSQQTISPDSGKVLSGVTLEPITSTLLTSLDSDFKAENIAEGVDMFGLVGTMQAGPSVETCTVTIKHSMPKSTLYAYTMLRYDSTSGVTLEWEAGLAASEPSFTNIVCGSTICFYIEGMITGTPSATTSGGATYVQTILCGSGYWFVCTAPDTAGAVATITTTV